MSGSLDLSTVRRFTEDLSDKLTHCDNGEGMVCATLEQRIQFYAEQCAALRDYINRWARSIFSGELAFDPEAEALLKGQAQRLLHRAKQTAANGRAMNRTCFELQGLDALHYFVADLEYLLENWVRPRRSVSPAPRVKPSDGAKKQIVERLEQLPPLPSDWRPTDPQQLAAFNEQNAM